MTTTARSIRSWRRSWCAALLGLLLPPALLATANAEARQPNVLFILADDLGWADIGCYGSTFHRTPNIDRLRARGLKFTQAYSASPLCSPTRASIMTGLAPARIGITQPTCHLPTVQLQKRLTPGLPRTPVLTADSVTRLKTDYFTLAEAFRDAGYVTAHIGKWHLGAEPYSPLEHGFVVDVPHTPGPGPGGGNGYFAPWNVWPGEGEPGDHIDDRMTDEAIGFMRAHRDKPFLLDFWTFDVHSPWMAKPAYVDEAASRADPDAAQRHPVYAGMVRILDDAVGRLLETLDELELTDDTIIIFSSDNGAWHNIAREATNDPRYAQTPVTSNAPLRSGKGSLYEGGTRTPLIVAWPGEIEAGSSTDTLWQSTDFFPTLAQACEVPVDPSTEFDGVSQVATLRGGPSPRQTVFCHFPHTGRTDIEGFVAGTSVRRGDWKLIRFFAVNDDGGDRLELYNLNEDLGETANRAADQPELVAELNALIDGFLAHTDAVIPIRNPGYVKQ